MLRSLRRTPQQSLGPIGLLPVRQVFGAPLAEAVGQGAPAYPPLAPASGAPSSRQWSLRLAPGDSLAVTHLGFVLAPGPQLALTLDGRPQPVAARDKLVTVWRCGEHCSGGDALLSVDSAEHARVDIVLF
jgi:hypothetical protein